jgi:hypothetical protein
VTFAALLAAAGMLALMLQMLLLPKAFTRFSAVAADAAQAADGWGGAAGSPLCLHSRLWYTEIVRDVMKSNTCETTAQSLGHVFEWMPV